MPPKPVPKPKPLPKLPTKQKNMERVQNITARKKNSQGKKKSNA